MKLEQLQKLAKQYRMIPIKKEIYADVITPITLLRRLAQKKQRYFLLESIEGGERWGRYSFLGFDPTLRVTCKAGKVTLESESSRQISTQKPLEVLRDILSDHCAPKLAEMPPFCGGLVGYLGYNMVTYAEPSLHLQSGQEKDFDMMLFDKVIAYDHLRQKITVIVNIKTDQLEANLAKAEALLESMVQLITAPMKLEPSPQVEPPTFACNKTEQEFCSMVGKAKQHIVDGDIFQAVLSCRFEAEFSDNLIGAYRVLRTTNPSPYMVYFHSEDEELICSSPETLIKLNGGRLSTFPVAGSRPRGVDAADDQRLRQELLSDEKELAEHNMLVDLGRNDIGKIAKFGSVHISEYKKIHMYSKIMHMTSVVEGDIRHELDACDALEAILPAGTLSGAPKVRACEVIQNLERSPRGIYGGALGYLDFTGNMDTCIAIRMAVKHADRVVVQAGAGIVYDSVPKKEYIECKSKARALIDALVRAGEVQNQ